MISVIYCQQKKEIIINTLDFLEIENIIEDILITKDKYIRVLKVSPINYDLKSDFEKQSIISAYKTVLKTCDFDFQILILSQKESIEKNIQILKEKLYQKTELFNKEKIFSTKEKESQNIESKLKKINKIYFNYLNFIKKINNNINISSKDFYIILCENKTNLKKEGWKQLLIKKHKKGDENKEFIKKERKKEGLHNFTKKEENLSVEKHLQSLDDKEKKLKVSIEKCGNIIKRLSKKELYELLVLEQKGESYFKGSF